jgi:hypothetical protein
MSSSLMSQVKQTAMGCLRIFINGKHEKVENFHAEYTENAEKNIILKPLRTQRSQRATYKLPIIKKSLYPANI